MSSVGIASTAYRFPERTRTVESIFEEEGAGWTPELAEQLGIEAVPVAGEERGSELALAAAREALDRAELTPREIGVIVDYTVLPQEYLVPAWSMSNKLQAELGAKKAFTIGFSGGGSTSLHVALQFATSLIRSDERVQAALLLGADLSIPGNRVLNPDSPLTVLGDAASAMVLQRDAPGTTILDTELWSDGVAHDVCYIPGGAMAHPDRRDLFRLRLDRAAYDRAPRMETLRRLTDTLLSRAGVVRDQIGYFLYPNLSAEDQREFASAFDVPEDRICRTNLAQHGHLQANDLVLNYRTVVDAGGVTESPYVLVCSHGMGFLSGVSLLRR